MEDEFFNLIYSTRRTVSIIELTNTKLWEEEPVVDYLKRWCALSLECNDRISETSAVEMCLDGMNWELLYLLKSIKPRSFQILAKRAKDMEITLKEHRNSRISSSKVFVKVEHEESDKHYSCLHEEAMVVITNKASAIITSE